MTADAKPLTYQFQPEDLTVVVHFEGSVYSFSRSGAPILAGHNTRTRMILRTLLESAVADLDAQVQS